MTVTLDADPTATGKTAQTARWALAAAFFVNGFLMGSWAPQIPFMLPRHQITEFTMGLLILGFGLGAIVAMSAAGWLLSHYGSKRVLLGFGLAACAAFVSVIFAPSLWLAALALWVMGGSIGAMDIGINANAVEIERRLDQAIMSSSHGFWSLGGFVGGGAGGLLIARFGAEMQALLATGIALAILAVAWRFLLTEEAHKTAEAKPKYQWPRGLAIYIVGLLALFSMIPEGAILDWSALYLEKELKAGVAVSGLAFALFSGAMAVMRFGGDAVRNRFGAVQTLRISGLVAALGMFLGGIAPSDWMVVAAFAFAGLGVANMVPIAFSAAGNQPGVAAGPGIALVTLMGYSGILIAPSAIGFVAEHIGFRVVYVALAMVLLIVVANAGRMAGADRRG